MALAAMAVLGRAVYLQVLNSEFLVGRADQLHVRDIQLAAYRGMIVDRNNEPLAASAPVESVCADPVKLLSDTGPEQRRQLAQLLGEDAQRLEQKLSLAAKQRRQFAYLRRHAAPRVVQAVSQLKLNGVFLKREYRRYYPDAEITAHLLGMTDPDDRGSDGLEMVFDDWLSGQPGSQRMIKDRQRRAVEPIAARRPPVPGKKLILSLDRRVQYLVYRSLATAMQKHRAAAAMAVVVDITTGEVLAMVNQPASDPNDRRQRDATLLRNRTVTDVFEPGSTLKPFAVAAALELGVVSPETLVPTAPGRLKIGRYTVSDFRNYKTLTVAEVLAKSSNVGVVKIARLLQPQELWRVYSGLGFGQRTGLHVIGERSGVLRHHSEWTPITQDTQAYGYGLAVTALQLAQAYAVLANDGIRQPLTLQRRGEPPQAQRVRVLSAKVSRQVLAMLEDVVRPGGTGALAAVPGYRVAGKTGTIRKNSGGKYHVDRYTSLFVGMVPVSQPRLVMTVVIDEPDADQAYYGGLVAAPVFSEVMSEALPLLDVIPDALPPDELGQLAVSRAGGAG